MSRRAAAIVREARHAGYFPMLPAHVVYMPSEAAHAIKMAQPVQLPVPPAAQPEHLRDRLSVRSTRISGH